MAVKRNKRTKRLRRRFLQAVKGGTLRLRKEPQAAAAPDAAAELPRPGSMRFDSEEFRLPEALAEAGETEAAGPKPWRVVLVITILAVVYIAIIAWFVSQMPEK
jgi:hypothetical protein